ncbi:MAG: ABC transporter ATP-binding protein [Dongiaceae bacterium]
MAADLLTCTDIEAGYGAVRVLDGVTLSIAAGTVTALLGSNGAGKTTLMRVIVGLLTPTAGEVNFDGASLSGIPSHERVAAGLSLVPEGRRLFAELTVEENLRLGAVTPRMRGLWRREIADAYTLFPRLSERRRQLAGSLSGGEQQMVAVARGMMARPRLLLLDEPTLGLAPLLVETIFQAIGSLRAQGATIFIAEQDVRSTLEIADAGYVLESGRIVLAGSSRALANDPRLRSAYLGM